MSTLQAMQIHPSNSAIMDRASRALLDLSRDASNLVPIAAANGIQVRRSPPTTLLSSPHYILSSSPKPHHSHILITTQFFSIPN